MAKTVTRVAFPPPLEKLKRVAAYARVSSGKDAMLHSLSAQVSYYSDLIQSHPGWRYVGVYSDEAITGTKDLRPGFQRLLDDCRAGKVDLVIAKSISRFARNTVTLLETVRELKLMDVDVFFEEQNIHTISSEGELMLSILASYAQEESLSNSENMKWRIRHSYEHGELLQWRYLYGYDISRGSVTVNEADAMIVREVFEQVINGSSLSSIARDLNGRNVKSTFGGVWTVQRVEALCRNEKYTGNALMQKVYINNYLEKKKRPNRGELPMYYIENSHPAIISMELFEMAKEVLDQMHQKTEGHKQAEKSPFAGMIRCCGCGAKYRRITANGHTSNKCGNRQTNGKSGCGVAKAIPETTMKRVTAEVLGLEEFDERELRRQVGHIDVPQRNHLIYFFRDGHTEERVWQDRSRSEAWTPEMKEKARQRTLERKAGKADAGSTEN